MQKLRVLITGHLGFVGTETKKYFEERDIEVIGFDIMEKGNDIRDIEKLRSVVESERPDRILHLAAIARFAEADANQLLADETNVRGTENVAKVAKEFSIPVVYASTGSVYMPIKGTPPITEDFAAVGNSEYGTDKRKGELYIQKHVHPWIILRYAHLYGKEKRYHGLIGGFLARIEKGIAPTLYGGKQSNDFTYIKDVARANYLAITASWDKWNQVYNIGTGEELTAEDAGKLVCEITGYTGEVKKEEMRTVDPMRFVFSCEKAERMLNFKAEFNFKKGLEDMFKEEKS
jgi:nucleoside-diphosphate-sugar epimerase